MLIEEARMKVERYVRQRGRLLGLPDLEEGLQNFQDILESDDLTKNKQLAANIVRTYRTELVEWVNQELLMEKGGFADPSYVAYSENAMELFAPVHELVGQDAKFDTVKKRVAELARSIREKEDGGIDIKAMIQKILALDEAEEKAAISLLRRLGINIEARVQRARARLSAPSQQHVEPSIKGIADRPNHSGRSSHSAFTRPQLISLPSPVGT